MFLLFSAAARTDLSVLWHIRDLPARLLAIGLPLTLRQEHWRPGWCCRASPRSPRRRHAGDHRIEVG